MLYDMRLNGKNTIETLGTLIACGDQRFGSNDHLMK